MTLSEWRSETEDFAMDREHAVSSLRQLREMRELLDQQTRETVRDVDDTQQLDQIAEALGLSVETVRKRYL